MLVALGGWLGSPYRHNSSYFCMVDQNGIPNYEYASNSYAVAPDFAIHNQCGSMSVAAYQVNNDLCERRNTSRDDKSETAFRCPYTDAACMVGEIVLIPISCAWAKQFRRTRYYNCTEGELYFMTSEERREARYQRRKSSRLEKRAQRNQQLGKLEEIFNYADMYHAGKKCCNGVRWKNSIQRFELHLFSGTAKRRRIILNRMWKPGKTVQFTISERGKTRHIDAPAIQDRQAYKVYTKKVLLPIYTPEMIWNNGASLPGKGFSFAQRELKADLCYHYRRYKRDGSVIFIDFKQFFPSVPHAVLLERHRQLLLADDIRSMGDKIVNSVPGDCGLPLGVEPSQAEMIAFLSPLDNFIKCQLSLQCAGHYMDDYYILVPPGADAKALLQLVSVKASEYGLTINGSKTRIVPLTKPFRYCKVKYTLTETGGVVTNGNRDNLKRARRKIKSFYNKIQNGEMGYDELYSSVSSILAYFNGFCDHYRVLTLRRLFHSLFGFSVENAETFRLLQGSNMKSKTNA